MQFTMEANWSTFAVFIAIGMGIASLGLVPTFLFWMRRTVINLKVDMMQRLPLTLAQIDADKEVMRAHHMIDLKALELKIAQAQASEAEANAMTAEGLNRIDKLNRRIEVLQLKLAAKSKTREIRKIDEQLIMLDSANTVLDADVA